MAVHKSVDKPRVRECAIERMRLGVRQFALAYELGVHSSTLSNFETFRTDALPPVSEGGPRRGEEDCLAALHRLAEGAA